MKLSEKLEEIECSSCSGTGYYCGNSCGACNGTGLEYSKEDIIEQLEKESEHLKRQIDKMKCCENCVHNDGDFDVCDVCSGFDSYDEWELAE